MGRARLCELIGDSHSGCLLIEAASSSPRLVPVNPVFYFVKESKLFPCTSLPFTAGGLGRPRAARSQTWGIVLVCERSAAALLHRSLDRPERGRGYLSSPDRLSLSLVLLTVVRLKVKKIGGWKRGGNKDNAHRTIYKRAAT